MARERLKLNPKVIAADIRSGMDARALARKHGIREDRLQAVFNKLLEMGAINQSDLAGGSTKPDRVIPTAWRCPACGKPQTETCDECPECGVIVCKLPEPEPPVQPSQRSVTEDNLGLYAVQTRSSSIWPKLVVLAIVLVLVIAWGIAYQRSPSGPARQIRVDSLKDPKLSEELLNAVQRRRTDAVSALLEQGADPNVRDERGFTPLMMVVSGRECSPFYALNALLRTYWGYVPEGVRASLSSYTGPDRNPMTVGNPPADIEMAPDSVRDIIEILLKQEADVNARADDGATAWCLLTESLEEINEVRHKFLVAIPTSGMPELPIASHVKRGPLGVPMIRNVEQIKESVKATLRQRQEFGRESSAKPELEKAAQDLAEFLESLRKMLQERGADGTCP